MKKSFRTLLTLFLLIAGTAMSWAEFKDFSALLNNGTGTMLLPAEYAADQTDVTPFGIAVDSEGKCTRVAADDASAVATIAGKYWNDHGMSNLVVTIPNVSGLLKITTGNCKYSNDRTVKDASGKVLATIAHGDDCAKNNVANSTEAIVDLGSTPQTITINCGNYCAYIKVEQAHTWDFRKWSATTVANLEADYQKAIDDQSWSRIEKVADKDNRDKAVEGSYWQVAHGTLTANGAEIAELKGLEFTNTNDRGLAIATNYPSTSLGTYAGPQYLWLGGKNIAYFTIKNVKVGSTIRMGVESHKPAEARGVTLTNVSENPAAPTVYAEQAWTVTGDGEAVDVTVTNTNGCHIYWIDAVIVEQKPEPGPTPTPGGEGAFDNVSGQIKWAVGNETRGAADEAIAAAVLDTKVSVGTDLSVTSTAATYTLEKEGTVGPYVTYQPQSSNPGAVEGDMIEYTIKTKKGITFKPTSVEFDAVKEGTDNAYFSWSYTVDGVESAITGYSDPKSQVRRNNDANPSAPLTHTESISADACRTFTLRFYISNVANDKKMSIGNIKINGVVNGTEETRAFKNFKVDFRQDPYTVVAPAEGLPEGVTINGTFHDATHGYNTTKITLPVDGPVKLTFGSCQFGSPEATVSDTNGNTTKIDTNDGCDSNTSFDHAVVWTYNSETPTTLTITTPSYIPFFYAEACELLPMVNVTYYNTDGKLIGSEEIQGGSKLAYKYSEKDVTIPAGQKFRGWFASTQSTALKIAEGTMIQDNIKLYARATAEEVVSPTARFIYDLTKKSFYLEDHEAIDIDGKYYNNHGWQLGSGKSIKVNVSEKAYITVGNCQYTAESEAIVTDADGKQVGTFQAKAPDGSDGAEYTIPYDGKAGWVTITFPSGAYVHSVSVSNVVDFLAYDEATGFYSIASGDVSSLLLAIKAASGKPGSKIYLPNGTYDLGETVLTTISGKNISIIGESMEGTIIRNCPPKENEGIGTTATLLNTSENLYMQDLTLQNALDYYATGAAGRAVCLQDKGKNTICKNVKMLSYQDTYYSNIASKFYWEDSEIHGTVDYLCGDGDIIYNRCKFVNESRAKNKKDGSDVLCAPYTSASCTWGYVFLDCAVESLCKDFTFARSWGGNSAAQFIRTKILDNSLNASRFTTAGMNVAAYKFKEFGTMDKDDKVTTPASNVITFTHKDGNKTYETVLSADEAAKYTVANIFGTWAPDVTCQQVTKVADGQTYLVNGQITNIKPADGTVVRIANTRGGFGPKVTIGATAVSAAQADAKATVTKYFDGTKVVIVKDNKNFNVSGQEIK